MPSLDEKVVEFLRDVKDTKLRDNALITIRLFRDVYRDGKANAEQILKDLKEVCMTVLAEKHPDLDEAMIREEADAKAREFFRHIGIETMAERMWNKYRGLTL